MNVACSACPAKYAVPDDKVRGKRARITCKHCGSAIIIDGTGLGPTGSSNSPQPSEAPRVVSEPPPSEPAAPATAATTRSASSPPARPGEGPWVVAISDEKQESANIPRVVELFGSGVIDADTYLWREGMSEWKTPFEIPQIEAALRSKSFFPDSPPVQPDEEATQIVPAPSEARVDRSLSRSSEDDESVTVAFNTALGRPSRAPLQPPRTYPSGNNAAPSGDARPAPGEQPRPQVRARTVTRLGMGSPAQPASAPPLQRPSAAPAVRSREDENGRAPAHRGTRPLPELRHQGLAAPPDSNRARRAHGRANGAEDLFADHESAELAEEPSIGMHADADLGPRMTGARNDSSVLFSLDALAKAEREPERPRRASVNSAELMYGTPPPPPPFVPTAQAYAHPLAAPDFTAPVRPEPPAPPPVAPPVVARARPDLAYGSLATDDFSFEPPRRRGRKVLVALLLLGGAVGGAFALGLPQKYLAGPSAPPAQEVPVLAIQPRPAATEAQPTEAQPTSTSEAAPEPSAAPAAAEPASPPAAAAQTTTTEARAPRTTASPPASRPSHPVETIEEPPETPARSSSLAEALAGEARKGDAKTKEEKSTAAKPEVEVEEITDAPPFDRGAAVSALGAAAGNAQSCKMPSGPTGSGQATVTFAPSGRVTSASVSGDFAGSSVGSCVAKLFRNARVPAFSGAAVTVTKRFSID